MADLVHVQLSSTEEQKRGKILESNTLKEAIQPRLEAINDKLTNAITNSLKKKKSQEITKNVTAIRVTTRLI